MTLSKPWYQSTTIQSAISAYMILLANTGLAMYQDGKFREPTTAEVTALIAGAVALKETIEGRKRAEAPIGKQQPIDTPVYPDFAAIAELPSAEFVTPEEAFVEDADSVDNEEEDTLDIDFSKLTGKYYLVAQTDTRLKTSPDQSSELAPEDYREVGQWQRIDIDFWSFLPEKNEHIEVRIDEYKHTNEGKFYVYAPHFKLFNILDKQIEIEAPTSPIPVIDKKLTPIRLPGYSSTFYLENQIYEGSHFYWSEALRGGSRMPTEKRQVDNIIAIARMLDKIRAFNGNRPMVITSWLRPPHINRQVGGVPNSRHITGDGVDFVIPGANMYDIQEKLKPFCRQHNLGLGLGAKRGFIHVDLNGFRVWNYG